MGTWTTNGQQNGQQKWAHGHKMGTKWTGKWAHGIKWTLNAS